MISGGGRLSRTRNFLFSSRMSDGNGAPAPPDHSLTVAALIVGRRWSFLFDFSYVPFYSDRGFRRRADLRPGR